MNPEFYFDEMIELIRHADLQELVKLETIFHRDTYCYSLFDLEMIDTAMRLKCRYIAKKDAREMKELFKKMGLNLWD